MGEAFRLADLEYDVNVGLTLHDAEELIRVASEKAPVKNKIIDIFAPSYSWFGRDKIGDVVLASCYGAGGYKVFTTASSRGSELYSIALTFLESGLKPEDVTFLGTDIDHEAVAQARDGSYEGERFENNHVNHLSTEHRETYFRLEGSRYRVRDDLKRFVNFERCDVLDSDSLNRVAEDKPYDVVLCRNILKYFSDEVAQNIVENLKSVMRPGSRFLMGASSDEKSLNGFGIDGFKREGDFVYVRE